MGALFKLNIYKVKGDTMKVSIKMSCIYSILVAFDRKLYKTENNQLSVE